MTFAIIMIFITLYLSAIAVWIQNKMIRKLNKKINDLEYKLTEKIDAVDLRLTKKDRDLECKLLTKADDNAFWCVSSTTDDKFKELDKTITEIEKQVITASFDVQHLSLQIKRFMKKKQKKEETDVQQEEAE